MGAGLFKLIAVVAVVVATTVACGSLREGAGGQREIVVDGYSQARGGVRLALPVEVPTGYRLDRLWSVANVYGEDGSPSSVARSAEFDGPDGRVRVCEEVADIPGRLCPASNVGITERQDGLIRTVSMASPHPVDPRAVWGEVRYSPAMSDWTWVDGS